MAPAPASSSHLVRRTLAHLLPLLLVAGLAVGSPARASASDPPAGPAGAGAAASGDPLDGRGLYVDPDSNARREAAAAREIGDEQRARLFDRIGDHSQADWFGDWHPTDRVRDAVAARVDEIAGAGALSVLVLYAIPARDCGGYSGGGLDSSEDYLEWVREVAGGIGSRRAAVVLEPDSLALLDCLSAAQRSQRLATLREAVSILTERDVVVYLDGGHSHWHAPAEMAERLRAAGVDGARGFALNVSNFRRTEDELAYGRAVSDRLDGAHFVVDTSRNGQGPHPDDEWCNPSGRRLGPTPRIGDTGESQADALLWIKRPGESDGACGRGEPEAGAWWAQYALDLAAEGAPEADDDAPDDEPGDDEPGGHEPRDDAAQPAPSGPREACPHDLPRAGFDDTRGSVHERVIDCLSWWGITTGVDATTFAPGAEVRRDQVATFLHRLLDRTGLLPASPPRRGFGDVAAAHPHREGIETLAGLEVINGTGDGRFSPALPATRGQMASLIVRLHEQVVGASVSPSRRGFTDIAGSTHEDSIRRLVTLEVTTGHDDGTFRPSAVVTRAQMAAFVMRYVDHLVAEGLADPPS